MGKRTAVLAGLATLVVLACAALFWDEIAARIALRRLRSEPARVLQAAAEARSPVEKRAIRLYLHEDAGGQAFLKALIEPFQTARQGGLRNRELESGLIGFEDVPP